MRRRGTVHPVWEEVTDREQKRQDQIHENQIQSPWYNDYKAAEVREGVSTRHFVMLNRPFDVQYIQESRCVHMNSGQPFEISEAPLSTKFQDNRDVHGLSMPCQGSYIGPFLLQQPHYNKSPKGGDAMDQATFVFMHVVG
jgi:hypothetical protein